MAEIPIIFIAIKNKNTPFLAKLVGGIAVVYILSPIDLIPDFIPVLGYLDDVIIVPALITLTIKLIPKEILEQSRKNAKEQWQNGKIKKWYYAIPVAIIWLLVIWLIIKAICKVNLLA